MLFSSDKNGNGEEFKKYISVNSTLSFDTLEPYLALAERQFLKPVLGADILAALQVYYDASLDSGSGSVSGSASGSGDSSPSDDKLQELLELCQGAVLNLAYLKGWSVLIIQLNNNGAARFENENNKGLYKYQEDAVLESFKADGFGNLDAVIAFLEEYIDVFPSFKDTEYYSINKSSLVQTTADFQRAFDINSSGLVFRRLRPYIRLVEKFSVIPLLGKDLYAELLVLLNGTGSGSGSSSDDWKADVLAMLQDGIPWLVMGEAVKTYGANITDNGFYLLGKKGSEKSDSTSAALSKDEKERLSRDYLATGEKYLQGAQVIIDENADDSGSGESTGYLLHRDNTDKKTFWT
jgi:hypothetical protein